jgi:hypothetical protein
LNYGAVLYSEWLIRYGRAHKSGENILYLLKNNVEEYIEPPWFNNQDFFVSHQSNLLRKDKEHYSKFFGNDIPDNLPYVWPV